MSEYDTIIIGAGIVGSAIAAYLSEDIDKSILVVDRSVTHLLGSTGHAPGFVGQVNESPILTKLAIESVKAYHKIPGNAFASVGGLELANSAAGLALLGKRLEVARNSNLPATLISAEEASSLMPPFVRQESYSHILRFASDGVADPKAITRAYQEIAASRGVKFFEADVIGLTSENSKVTAITTAAGKEITAAQVVLATGIWTSDLLLRALNVKVPIVPVGHPYLYSNQREKLDKAYPFIRWPEKHVYARDHGDRTGFGTYAHAPQLVRPSGSAIEPWESKYFDEAVKDALAHQISSGLGFESAHEVDVSISEPTEGKFNGVFAVTPDGLPLVGDVDGVDGLWIAAAVWVTHAAGAAKLLANKLGGRVVDDIVWDALSPNRFSKEDQVSMVKKALGTYNDIYGSENSDH